MNTEIRGIYTLGSLLFRVICEWLSPVSFLSSEPTPESRYTGCVPAWDFRPFCWFFWCKTKKVTFSLSTSHVEFMQTLGERKWGQGESLGTDRWLASRGPPALFASWAGGETLIAPFLFSLPNRKFLTWSQTNTSLNFWRPNLALEQRGMTGVRLCLLFDPEAPKPSAPPVVLSPLGCDSLPSFLPQGFRCESLPVWRSLRPPASQHIPEALGDSSLLRVHVCPVCHSGHSLGGCLSQPQVGLFNTPALLRLFQWELGRRMRTQTVSPEQKSTVHLTREDSI